MFDRATEIGGQLNLAKQVAGKEEFWGFVDWYRTMVAELGIDVRLETEVSADDLDGFDDVIIATGVVPRDPQIPGQDSDKVVSYIDVLNGAATVGQKVAVIGAGVIGLELGSVYARLGTEVQVVEFLDAITPGMDAEVQKTFQKLLTKQGLSFTMGAAVQSVAATKTKAKVTYKLRKDDSEHSVDADIVLVATGRKPYTDGLGLEALGDRKSVV